MKIAILGYAGQGQSAREHWDQTGNELTVCDRDPNVDLPPGVASRLGDDYLKDLDEFDLLIRTPALHPRDIQSANPDSPDILDKVTTVTNEFFKVCPTKNIIGVTGTKGKGTTSTLIAKMLEATGKTVHLGGNIGIPPLELLKNGINADDWVVLELANFQLIDLKYSPRFGVCLMVEPEHLDWHSDINDYIAAKQQMFTHQAADDIAVYYAKNDNSKTVVSVSPGQKKPYFAPPGATVENKNIIIGDQTICRTDELRILGQHNWQNACAAVTLVWQIAPDTEAIRQVLTTFSGLPFRLELRRELDGIRYYNDSFASAPDACQAALQAVEGPKVLIVGGFERGLNLSELAKDFKAREQEVRHVLVIGATAERIAENLKRAGFTNFTISKTKAMEEIVEAARQLARPGDAVVLSPGFASFDMFKNFEDRGLQFNEAVEKL